MEMITQREFIFWLQGYIKSNPHITPEVRKDITDMIGQIQGNLGDKHPTLLTDAPRKTELPIKPIHRIEG